jgi:hypothetical protein
MDSSNAMEVNWISTKLECLTDILKLNVFDSADARFVTW